MTREAMHARRLGRLLALAGAEGRQSARALAAALRAADEADQKQRQVDSLIAGTRDAAGRQTPATLSARAQLRLLLQPAGDAAATSAASANTAKAGAEAKLAEARAPRIAPARAAGRRPQGRSRPPRTPPVRCNPREAPPMTSAAPLPAPGASAASDGSPAQASAPIRRPRAPQRGAPQFRLPDAEGPSPARPRAGEAEKPERGRAGETPDAADQLLPPLLPAIEPSPAAGSADSTGGVLGSVLGSDEASSDGKVRPAPPEAAREMPTPGAETPLPPPDRTRSVRPADTIGRETEPEAADEAKPAPAAGAPHSPPPSVSAQTARHARPPAAMPAEAQSESNRTAGAAGSSADSRNGARATQMLPFRFESPQPFEPSPEAASAGPTPISEPHAGTAPAEARAPADVHVGPSRSAEGRFGSGRAAAIDVTIATATPDLRDRIAAAQGELRAELARIGTEVDMIRVELRGDGGAQSGSSQAGGGPAGGGSFAGVPFGESRLGEPFRGGQAAADGLLADRSPGEAGTGEAPGRAEDILGGPELPSPEARGLEAGPSSPDDDRFPGDGPAGEAGPQRREGGERHMNDRPSDGRSSSPGQPGGQQTGRHARPWPGSPEPGGGPLPVQADFARNQTGRIDRYA